MTLASSNNDTIILPDAPAIPGLTFRTFRGSSDYPAMLAVINGSKIADQNERTDTLEGLTHMYAHLTNCDPYQDVLIVQMYDDVIAYSRVWWWQETAGNRIYGMVGFLLPAWRRQGIGRAMLQHNERRLRQIAATHPDDGPRLFNAWISDTSVSEEALFRSEGYTAIRYGFDMLRDTLDDLPDAPLPAGLELRPVQPEHYRAIWDADVEAFQDHWGYSPPTETDYQRWLNGPVFQPHLWRIAWDGDQIAGQVLSFINAEENAEYHRQRGYTEFISVRRPWRKRGLARALIVESFHALKAAGMTEAALGVDAENLTGALRVYESVGFHVTKHTATYRKPLD